jgi:hypothetical protein
MHKIGQSILFVTKMGDRSAPSVTKADSVLAVTAFQERLENG